MTEKLNLEDKIVGPGNSYVMAAKKEVFGDVGIEGMVAGPSEITIVADKNTSLNQVITSMVGQAEHDINSQCILITKDKNLIKLMKKFLNKELNKIPRKIIAKKSINVGKTMTTELTQNVGKLFPVSFFRLFAYRIK